ncbi:hypothetical protein TGAM01_v201675, partial [Trichoderma gamsii]
DFFLNVVVDRLETTGGVAKVFFNIDASANRWLNNRQNETNDSEPEQKKKVYNPQIASPHLVSGFIQTRG